MAQNQQAEYGKNPQLHFKRPKYVPKFPNNDRDPQTECPKNDRRITLPFNNKKKKIKDKERQKKKKKKKKRRREKKDEKVA